MPSSSQGKPWSRGAIGTRKYEVLISQNLWIMPLVVNIAGGGEKNFRKLVMRNGRQEGNAWMVSQGSKTYPLRQLIP